MAAFKEWLKKSNFKEKVEENTPYDQIISALQQVADNLNDELSTHKIKAALESAFITDLGQQFKLILSLSESQYSVILFRAYVAADGTKVSFDFYDEDLTPCSSDEDDIYKAVNDFLMRPATLSQIKQLIDYSNRIQTVAPAA
ncbi:MAG: hypothetical protein NTX50_00285 [Candidatus Sumerlaeota bacterium]|nr:hypothetical protein [Candidatus Sumerlaeota bacterium]